MNTNVCLLFFVSVSVAGAAFPSSFAFSNEAFLPVELPAGTPSFTYDDQDPGGYTYFGLWSNKMYPDGLKEDDLPYCPHNTLYSAWLLVVLYEAPPVIPFEWNCTSQAPMFTQADFTGNVGGHTICEVGACCSSLYGLPKYGVDQMTWHKEVDEKMKAGMCAALPEYLYCTETAGGYHSNCFEYWLGGDEITLLHPVPCMDNKVQFLFSCPVFQKTLTLYFAYGMMEPESFLDAHTNEELITLDATYQYSELFLCQPYSYYNPAGTSESGTTSPGTPASVDSGSSLFHTLFTTVLVLIVFT